MYLTGRSALLAALAGVALLTSPGWASLLLVNAVVLLLVGADVALTAGVRELVITREGDTAVRLGEPASTTLTVTNPGRRPARGVLRDAWEPSAGSDGGRVALHVPAGERQRLTVPLLPTRRGDRHAVRVTVRTRGPLGLAGRQGRHVVPGRLRVLPGFGSRRLLPERLRRLRVVQGQVAARGAGRGSETDGLRVWSDGDDARDVDWRASARARDLVVRVQRPERDRRVVLCLDSGRTSATRIGDATRLDHAYDAALLLTALAERARDRVDLIVHDAVLRADVPGTGRGSVLRRQADVMAVIDPALVECDHRALAARLLARLPRRALIVLVTDLLGPVVEESLLPVLPALVARHTVLVAAASDPALQVLARDAAPGSTAARVEAVHESAAARRALTDRARVAAGLRRAGVVVVDVPADALPAALADAYLQLKAAGKL
jgi:uncharacterized protein (DUF58 family)